MCLLLGDRILFTRQRTYRNTLFVLPFAAALLGSPCTHSTNLSRVSIHFRLLWAVSLLLRPRAVPLDSLFQPNAHPANDHLKVLRHALVFVFVVVVVTGLV